MQAGLDLLETCRVGLDLRRVGAQRMRRFFEICTRRREHLERLLEVRIKCGGLTQTRLCLRDDVDRRILSPVERLFGFGRGSRQLRRVGEDGAARRQFVVLAWDKLGALEFGDAKTRELEQVRALPFAALQIHQPGAKPLRAIVQTTVVCQGFFEAGVTIEHLLMALLAQQRLLLMLAVDLDERRAETGQRLHGCERVIYRYAGAAALGNHTANYEFALTVVA